jgi:hypothetical protein
MQACFIIAAVVYMCSCLLTFQLAACPAAQKAMQLASSGPRPRPSVQVAPLYCSGLSMKLLNIFVCNSPVMVTLHLAIGLQVYSASADLSLLQGLTGLVQSAAGLQAIKHTLKWQALLQQLHKRSRVHFEDTARSRHVLPGKALHKGADKQSTRWPQ